MSVSFSLNYQGQQVSLDIEEADTEALTNYSWKKLYESAQQANLPYYWASVVIIKNQDKLHAHCYDGSTLNKLKKLAVNDCFHDPQTRSPILTIHHLFFNCFELEWSGADLSLTLNPLTCASPASFSFDDLADPVLIDLAQNGLNSLAVNAAGPSQLELIGKINFIIGSKLLNHPQREEKSYLEEEEDNHLGAIQWLVSSSRLGNSQAKKLLEKERVFISDTLLEFIK